MSGKTLIVTTSDLRSGDVVLTNGMRVLIEGEPNEYDGYNSGERRTVYHWKGLVTNLEDVKEEQFIPISWLYPDKWVPGQGWNKDYSAKPRWVVQGNELARWTVERVAEG